MTACESYGDVTGVNQVGGIAGAASAKLRSNWAKCALSGEKYIGGIVGQGTDSDLTDGSLIAINNRAIVSVLEGRQYVSPADRTAASMATSSSPTICRASTA